MKTAITAIERVYSIKCRKPRLLKCLEFCVENILNDPIIEVGAFGLLGR